QRRARLDHDRRVRQHHRGLLASARREHRVRAAGDPLGVAGQRLSWAAMAAPRFAPTPETLHYESPPVVPTHWTADRPGDIVGFQPVGPRLGAQGPDQGYALRLANRLAPSLVLQPGERTDDAVRGCLGIALRRASLFGRAPVIHDLRLAFTIWGFFLDAPPADLLQRRKALFEGVGRVTHHYA